MNMSNSKEWGKIGKDLIDKICTDIELEDISWTDEGAFDINKFIKRYGAYKKLTKLEHDLIAYLDFETKDKPISTIQMINEIRKCLGDDQEYK